MEIARTCNIKIGSFLSLSLVRALDACTIR